MDLTPPGRTSSGRTPDRMRLGRRLSGLMSLLLRAGARRPHVLLVPATGGTEVRWVVERELIRRGWPVADAPADADLVVVAGRAGAELAGVVERIWAQVPAPRARIALRDPDPGVIATALQNAAASLAASPADPAHPQPPNTPDATITVTDSDSPERRGTDNTPSGPDANAPDGAGDDTRADMDGDMEMPGGLAMADLGADRDGLRLDRLHVLLGPVLPEWPAGLVVRVALQGDVIQEADVEVLDSVPGGAPAGADARLWEAGGARTAARELDALARFLSVAGWPDAAAQARQVRDDLLIGVPTGQVAAAATALARRVRRSRTLFWMVRDLGAAGARAGGLDVLGRLGQRLDAVEAAIADPDAPAPPRPPVEELVGLLVGAEFAAARLIVAVLDPDTESDPATIPAPTTAPGAGEPPGGCHDGGSGSGGAHG